jgi:hypothetical protein
MKAKTYTITRSRAIKIAADHNNVSQEVAGGYTNSELMEVLRHLRIKAIIS